MVQKKKHTLTLSLRIELSLGLLSLGNDLITS